MPSSSDVGAVIPDLPIASFIFRHAAATPGKAAVIDGVTHRILTYADLIGSIDRTAAGLAALGVQAGDVVAVYGPNSPEYIIAFYAVTSLGAIITSLNPLHGVAELSYQLMDAGARTLVLTCEMTAAVRRASERAGVMQIVAFEDTQLSGVDPRIGVSACTDVVRDPRSAVASLTYSNAMSDVPMGVMLTHRNIVANVVQTDAVQRVEPNEVLLGLTPFCHMYGMVSVNLGLRAGATIVAVPQFSLPSLLEAMDRYRVTTAYLVPAVIRTLARNPLVGRFDLSALRHITSMTAPLPKAVGRACTERLGCTVNQAYGLTHAVAFTHITSRDFLKDPSVGLLVPDTECRIVDVASRQSVATDTLGEVCVRGPQVMKGFHNYPEITRDVIDEDGWLHTGDLGYCDSEGYLFVVDRSKKLGRLRRMHRYDDALLRAAVDDIAARQEAADRLNLQSVLLDSVRESVVSTDLQNNVIFWNKGAEQLFGYSASEAIGKPVASLIVPDGATLTSPDKTVALRSHGKWDARVVRRRKDGSIIWADLVVSIVKNASGERVGFLGIYRDTTEQRLVEQRLRFQAQLLDSVRESVVATDLSGRITFWGNGAEALFGYSQREMIGSHLSPLTWPLADDPDEEFIRVRDEVIRQGAWSARSVLCRRSCSDFWADITLAPVRGADGEPVGVIAIHRDVSELHESQELLRDSHERLHNLASRLIVIRELERSSIARELHDELGQALTRLNIDLCWLTDQLPQRLKTKRVQAMRPLVDMTIKAVQHISSELRPAILDDLGLEAAVEWHVHEFAEWSGCRCELDLRMDGMPRDRDRDITVFRILQEALTNVARHARAEVVQVRASTRDGAFILEVEDDGVGVREEELASSSSLGIIGMRERAECLGGQIDIVARPRQGTRVTLRLGIAELHARKVQHDPIAHRR